MEMRKTEVLKDGKWVQCKVKDLKSGDKMRMFESNGDPVKTIDECTEFTCSGDAFFCDTNNQWCVYIDGGDKDQ